MSKLIDNFFLEFHIDIQCNKILRHCCTLRHLSKLHKKSELKKILRISCGMKQSNTCRIFNKMGS